MQCVPVVFQCCAPGCRPINQAIDIFNSSQDVQHVHQQLLIAMYKRNIRNEEALLARWQAVLLASDAQRSAAISQLSASQVLLFEENAKRNTVTCRW